MTIKIIDLLNKIANGEEVPKKIRINGYIYEYQGDDYLFIDKNNDNHEYWLFSERYTDKFQWLDNFLKTEVEVIEEDKKIEKIKALNNVGNCQNLIEFGDKQQLNNHILKDKINEIIDAINELKKGE